MSESQCVFDRLKKAIEFQFSTQKEIQEELATVRKDYLRLKKNKSEIDDLLIEKEKLQRLLASQEKERV